MSTLFASGMSPGAPSGTPSEASPGAPETPEAPGMSPKAPKAPGKVFLVNFNRCNGCRNCQIVCKDEFCEQPWLPYSEAQPLTGQFWMNVRETVRGQVPWVRISYQPTFCNHCSEAPCLAAAPDAVYRRADGLVIIDPAKALGRRELADACPLGAIFYNEQLGLPQKCTGCAHLLDNGWTVPRCVDACPTDALLYVDYSEVDKERAEFLNEVSPFGPRVYFYHKPKRFIAGTVFNSEIDEICEGERVALLHSEKGLIAEQLTDDFGDFTFDQIEAGLYTVSVAGQNLTADVRERDLSLGDIDLA
jgi:Fe-S-cluster-containing dehydrogenase component